MKYLWVYMTAPTAEVAQRLVRAAVEARLAACGNILPRVRSIYRWKGRVESGSEVVAVLKTTARRWPALVAALRRGHPYECPCLVAVEIARGFPPFLNWIADACGSIRRSVGQRRPPRAKTAR